MPIALDTLEYARRLRESGFTDEQAEGQAEALAAAMTDSLATKQDLRDLEVRMDSRFAQVDARFAQVDSRFAQVDARFAGLEKQINLRFAEQDARFEGKLANLERRVTFRLGGIMVAGVGAIATLVTLF